MPLRCQVCEERWYKYVGAASIFSVNLESLPPSVWCGIVGRRLLWGAAGEFGAAHIAGDGVVCFFIVEQQFHGFQISSHNAVAQNNLVPFLISLA